MHLGVIFRLNPLYVQQLMQNATTIDTSPEDVCMASLDSLCTSIRNAMLKMLPFDYTLFIIATNVTPEFRAKAVDRMRQTGIVNFCYDLADEGDQFKNDITHDAVIRCSFERASKSFLELIYFAEPHVYYTPDCIEHSIMGYVGAWKAMKHHLIIDPIDHSNKYFSPSETINVLSYKNHWRPILETGLTMMMHREVLNQHRENFDALHETSTYSIQAVTSECPCLSPIPGLASSWLLPNDTSPFIEPPTLGAHAQPNQSESNE